MGAGALTHVSRATVGPREGQADGDRDEREGEDNRRAKVEASFCPEASAFPRTRGEGVWLLLMRLEEFKGQIRYVLYILDSCCQLSEDDTYPCVCVCVCRGIIRISTPSSSVPNFSLSLSLSLIPPLQSLYTHTVFFPTIPEPDYLFQGLPVSTAFFSFLPYFLCFCLYFCYICMSSPIPTHLT